MPYPDNFNSAAFDAAYNTTTTHADDVNEIRSAVIAAKPALLRTNVSAIRQILQAQSKRHAAGITDEQIVDTIQDSFEGLFECIELSDWFADFAEDAA